MKKGTYVKIIKATYPSWYEPYIGDTFRVCKRTCLYSGGKGYRCLDRLGGILVSDCEIIIQKEGETK